MAGEEEDEEASRTGVDELGWHFRAIERWGWVGNILFLLTNIALVPAY
jgi:hypothetical protein